MCRLICFAFRGDRGQNLDLDAAASILVGHDTNIKTTGKRPFDDILSPRSVSTGSHFEGFPEASSGGAAEGKKDGKQGIAAGSTEDCWVQCDKCSKWRRLPNTVDVKKLPVKWFCHMNKHVPHMASCDAPEEQYTEQVNMGQIVLSPLELSP